jgi:hypothetical protein
MPLKSNGPSFLSSECIEEVIVHNGNRSTNKKEELPGGCRPESLDSDI